MPCEISTLRGGFNEICPFIPIGMASHDQELIYSPDEVSG